MALLLLGFLLSVLHPATEAQTVIGSSSSFPLVDPPLDSSPPPTKHGARFWPPLPPGGRSDVPIRAATATDRQATTNAAPPGGRRAAAAAARPTAQSPPPFLSALSTQNLSGGPIPSRPAAAARPRTDMAGLAFSRASPTKGSPPPTPTAAAKSAADKPAAGSPEEGSLKESGDGGGLQEFGSGAVPSATPAGDESPIRTTASGETPDGRTAETTAGKTSTTPRTETRAPPQTGAPPSPSATPTRTATSSGKRVEVPPSTARETSTPKPPGDEEPPPTTAPSAAAATLPATREAAGGTTPKTTQTGSSTAAPLPRTGKNLN
ncbi:hypothetical protein EYF80_065659 [Liparis tanakae]|uniref:Uncharacterized protein n=1 Tax=Liparis tanakae TaxID=230148 RepID=A0A4Z2E641_9TELE|nr:hypothetical protein EYF80_065659 [Liparis tanakae]